MSRLKIRDLRKKSKLEFSVATVKSKGPLKSRVGVRGLSGRVQWK